MALAPFSAACRMAQSAPEALPWMAAVRVPADAEFDTVW